jgi:murein DD-endopeptidase MepM/ murein hydrolase activator NlpD
MKFFYIIFFLFVFLPFTRASIKRNKLDVGVINNRIIKLRASLNSLDKKLAFRNNVYIAQLEKLKKIETDLDAITREYEEKKIIVRSKLTELQKFLYLKQFKNSLSSNIEEKMVFEKVYKKKIQAEYQQIKKLVLKSKQLDQKIKQLTNDLKKTQKNQKILYSVLSSIESEKTLLAGEYFKAIDQKTQRQKKRLKRVLRQELKKIGGEVDLLAKAIAPIQTYVNYERSRKGVRFFLKKPQKIRSILDGTIDYVGNLSTYGNIIVIDHGEELRSVYLGHFDSHVEKNLKVQKGEKIALLKAKTDKEFYFEVRKNEKNLNVSKLIAL